MDKNNDIPITTNQLVKLFAFSKKVEITPWKENNSAIGLSILKDYPKKGSFIPILDGNGKQDSVVQIRIWCLINDLIAEKNLKKVKLNFAVVKSSRYIFKHNFYGFSDDSPTEAAIAKSEASKQPIDIEDGSRYELNVNTLKIYDLKNNQYVKPKTVVDDVYKLHLSTINNFFFQTEIALQKNIIELIDPINKFLEKINLYLFGKKIKETKNFGVGSITPYAFKDLGDATLIPEKTTILGSNLPISYQAAATFVSFFSAIFIINYILHYDVLGLVKFISSITNTFFLAVITIAMLLFVDRGIPYAILFLINLLIRLKWRLLFLKFKI